MFKGEGRNQLEKLHMYFSLLLDCVAALCRAKASLAFSVIFGVCVVTLFHLLNWASAHQSTYGQHTSV